jgi:hypothetical protein
MATLTDKKVQQLFEVVQKKKEEIKKIEKPNWFTNCAFRPDTDSTVGSFNLQTVSDPNVLVLALSKLQVLKETAERVSVDLGVEGYKFSHLGFSFDDWKSDFQTRVAKIQISKKKSELASLETRLNSLISPELKAELELEAISKELGI